MVSARPPIFSSSCFFTKHLRTVSSASITIGIIISFLFYNILVLKQVPSTYLSFCLLFFYLCFAGTGMSTIQQVLIHVFVFWIIIRSGLLGGIRWSVYISESQRTLGVSFFKTDSGLCLYRLSTRSNFNFFYNSLWITFTTQSCLVLYFFWASFLHSFIICVGYHPPFPHNELVHQPYIAVATNTRVD